MPLTGRRGDVTYEVSQWPYYTQDVNDPSAIIVQGASQDWIVWEVSEAVGGKKLKRPICRVIAGVNLDPIAFAKWIADNLNAQAPNESIACGDEGPERGVGT